MLKFYLFTYVVYLTVDFVKCSSCTSSGSCWEYFFSDGFLPDTSLEIKGFIPSNLKENSFSINLDCGSDKNIALHFNPRFSQRVIVRNTMKNGAWGSEERNGGFRFNRNENFQVKIICQTDDLKILVKGVDFATYKHRLDPITIRSVRITGDVLLDRVLYETKDKQQASVDLFSPKLTCNQKHCWEHNLSNKFPPKSSLVIRGFVPYYFNIDRFTVSLECGTEQNAALRLESKPLEMNLLRSSVENGKTIQEAKSASLILPGENFTLSISSQTNAFKIQVNGVDSGNFKHGKFKPGDITNIKIQGPLEIHNILYNTNNMQGVVDLFSKELFCKNMVSPCWEHNLSNRFPPESSLAISGYIPKDTQRFSINLDCGSDKNVALHFNPRFSEKFIARNSMDNGKWNANEEKRGGLPLKSDAHFYISIICQTDAFRILINGKAFTNFMHRRDPNEITNLRILGPIQLIRVLYNTKEVVGTRKEDLMIHENIVSKSYTSTKLIV